MHVIIEGIGTGLTLAIMLGPIFIVIMQACLESGTRGGLAVATGIWFSDIVLLLLSISLTNKISPYIKSDNFDLWVGIIGGIILIAIGIVAITKKTTMQIEGSKIGTSGWFGYWAQGLMVNTLNPFTFFFWFIYMPSRAVKNGFSAGEVVVFASLIAGTIIATDLLKVLMAKYIRKIVTEGALVLINKLAGSALILFGIALLWNTVT